MKVNVTVFNLEGFEAEHEPGGSYLCEVNEIICVAGFEPDEEESVIPHSGCNRFLVWQYDDEGNVPESAVFFSTDYDGFKKHVDDFYSQIKITNNPTCYWQEL